MLKMDYLSCPSHQYFLTKRLSVSSILYLALVYICVVKIVVVVPDSSIPSNNLHEKVTKKLAKKNDILPPCQLCRTLVDSFKKGLDETRRGKFEGGDADWEESRLKNYANSELRLVEIQEKLCSNIDKAQDQCHTLVEEHESVIEDWWFKKRKDEPELHTFLCINHLKVCCPPNHYGPECKPCKGDVGNPCTGHGKCKGAGTRKGSGDCKCNDGYMGDLCDTCAMGYFKNETKVEGETETTVRWECSKCHKACKGHCREEGPKACEVCANGYQHLPEYGCTDIDECIELPKSPCSGNTFCANTDGSYICMECDKTCNGCDGDGPDMCVKCADNYFLKEGVCVEKAMWKKALHANLARYVTYLGLFIATFIIFKRSSGLAYLVGSIVAAYVAIAEYTLGNWEDFFTLSFLKSFLTL